MGSKPVSERYIAWAGRMSKAVDKNFRKYLSRLKSEYNVKKIGFSIVGSFHWAFNSIGYMFGGGKEFDFSYGDKYPFRRKKGGLGFKLEGLYCLFALMIPVFALIRAPFFALAKAKNNSSFYYDPNPGITRGINGILSGAVTGLTVIIWALLAAQAVIALISLARGWRRFLAYAVNSALLWAMSFTKFGFWLFAAMLIIGIFASDDGMKVMTVGEYEYKKLDKKLDRELKAIDREKEREAARSSASAATSSSYSSSRSSSSSRDSSYSREEELRKQDRESQKKQYEKEIGWDKSSIQDLMDEIKKYEKSLDDYYKHPNSFLYDLNPEAVKNQIRKKKDKIRDLEDRIKNTKRKIDELDRS